MNLSDFYALIPQPQRQLVKLAMREHSSVGLHAAADLCLDCGQDANAAYWHLAADILAVLEELAVSPKISLAREGKLKDRFGPLRRIEIRDGSGRHFWLRGWFYMCEVRILHYTRLLDESRDRWFTIAYRNLEWADACFAKARDMADWLFANTITPSSHPASTPPSPSLPSSPTPSPASAPAMA